MTEKIIKEQTFYVRGMHCASCELLIEKKLLEMKGVKSVEASADKGKVLVEYEGGPLSVGRINKIFEKEGYFFSDQPMAKRKSFKPKEFFITFGTAFLIILGFIGLNKLGLGGLINVTSKSSLPIFFLLGLIAGISSCAALVGGLILSLSKQWSELYSAKDGIKTKIQPHLMFNIGRLVSYAVLGAVLGMLGSRLQISLTFTSVLVIVVSIMMVFLAFQMLGVGAFRKFQVTLPRFITRYVADESKFKGRYMPFLMGALTFFLPCGFTITAQGLALISGNPIQGGLIMLFFALGTLPTLFAIGLSSVKFSQRPHLSARFLKIAAILVLFFALYNINSQLNVLGFSGFNNISPPPANNSQNGLPPVVNGKQIIKMEASVSGYKPNYFKVRVGVPVRWEITDKGTSGCTNAVISKNLFEGEIKLTPGQTSVKEFTPTKTGKYKFSCWMGMVTGVIEVVDEKSTTRSLDAGLNNVVANDNSVIPSGASGCSCGGGGAKSSCSATQ